MAGYQGLFKLLQRAISKSLMPLSVRTAEQLIFVFQILLTTKSLPQTPSSRLLAEVETIVAGRPLTETEPFGRFLSYKNSAGSTASPLR